MFFNIEVFSNNYPNNEIRCMRFFDHLSVNNNIKNAYLLSLLNHYMAPHLLLNLPENHQQVSDLHYSSSSFRGKYREKTKHWFYNPNNPISENNRIPKYDFIAFSDNVGLDPEAMIISTTKYIIVIFRGTDRVRNFNPIIGSAIYDWGEWISTSTNYNPSTPPFGIRGRVHGGFNKSLLYAGPGITFIDSLAKKLIQRGVNSKSLWITGHSLGGAHATLAALYLKIGKQINAKCIYAYASPHVGSYDLVEVINSNFPGYGLQRFDFMDDPITRLPLYSMEFNRAGTRIKIMKESGANNYRFNADEESGDDFKPLFCFHHTHWYSRSIGLKVFDSNPEMGSKLPGIPQRPVSACSNIDYNLAAGDLSLGSLATSVLFNGFMDIEEGKYYIVNAKSIEQNSSQWKYLSVTSSLSDQNGADVEIHNVTPHRRWAQWSVKRIGNSLFSGYTLQLVDGEKYLDADLGNIVSDGCDVQLWERGFGIRTNQEWYIGRQEDGSFIIKNIMASNPLGDHVLHVRNSETNTNGANSELIKYAPSSKSQRWYFIKVNN